MNDLKKQAYNPYLPSWEYIPDAEPYVYGERLYIFGSHDRFNGTQFCMNDYVCWSASVDDLSDWKYEGVIYRKLQDPYAKEDSIMQAPDMVQGADGRYYLYYTLGLIPFMCVAVSDKITGPYEFYGRVQDKEGQPIGIRGGKDLFQFDPGVFRDDDGRIYLYSGFAPEELGEYAAAFKKYHLDGSYVMELEEDMLTIKEEPKRILPNVGHSEGTGFEGHEFYEASSMRKINGKYYLVYSSILQHELCYAISDCPDRDFSFGGTLVSNGDVGYNGRKELLNYTGNTHGSLVNIRGQWYIFYHRQTNRHNYSRQACAEAVYMDEKGHFSQAEITSCGLNGKPLEGVGVYPAHIACNLWSKEGALQYGVSSTPEAKEHPYFTQKGEDRESDENQYIANMRDGATAGYKYFSLDKLSAISLLMSGTGNGVMQVRTDIGAEPIAEIKVDCRGTDEIWFETKSILNQNLTQADKGTALYFTYTGDGSVNFHGFVLE